MFINKNYIIFIWIIALILFVYYCIFRMKYIHEKYFDLPKPTVTEPRTIMGYIAKIEDNNKIVDIETCQNIYDDNFKIQELGFSSCENGYAEYVNKNLDVNNKYGREKSFAEICPVASNSPMYNECAKLLLTKFSDSNIILDNVTSEINNSINKRLIDRHEILDDTLMSLSPFLYSKNQKDFDKNILLNKQVSQYSDQTLNLVDYYYQDKYKYIEKFTNLVNSDVESLFFGSFIPVNGQMLALNNLVLSIEYDTSGKKKSKGSNMKFIPLLNETIIPSLPSTPMTTTSSNNIPAPELSVTKTIQPAIFTIRNNDLEIVYDIKYIDFYKTNKNAAQFILDDKEILYQNYNDTNITEQLLSILGLNTTSHLVLVVDTFTSTEKIKHTNYRLVNDNLDTILILQKI